MRGFAVEEEDVGLHFFRVEDAGRKAYEGVDVGLFEQGAPYRLPRACLEEDIVRQHDRGAAVLLEEGEDVLEEVELIVARARPEVVAVDDERFFRCLARSIDYGDAVRKLLRGELAQISLA